MDTIGNGIDMMMSEWKKEFGETEKIEEGDQVAGVFNDGVIIISMEDKNLKVNVIAGEPYKFDYNLDLLE